MGKLYLSNRLDLLAQCLADQPKGLILVPNASVKQWLLIRLALLSANKGILGVKICTWEAVYPQQSLLELQCAIYPRLNEEVCRAEGAKRKIEISERLAMLFSMYRQYGHLPEDHWQTKLFAEVIEPLPYEAKQGIIHCFGFDFLPPACWQFLQMFSSCHIYLFSPCQHFWGDVCSEREQRRLIKKMSPAAREDLEQMFAEAPALLANWGKLGRETLKVLDTYPLEMEEVYEDIEGSSQLQLLQKEMLFFEKTTFSPDASIVLCKAGSSRWQEIKWAREEILSLGLPFSDIAILAPDISPYIPIIEYLFADKIPCRFSSVDLSSKSPFYRKLTALVSLAGEPWTSELLVPLLVEERWIDWVEEIFSYSPDWEKGFQKLLLRNLSLSPGPATHQVPFSDMDSLEALLEFLQSLQTDLITEASEAALGAWAVKWEALAAKYLKHGAEKDAAALETFLSCLRQLREITPQPTVPFALIAPHLLRRSSGPLRGNHLHAVRIESLEDGAALPAKAIFLIGMDEESFPRKNSASSLDLLKKESKADQDRYLFLRALFSAEKLLRISYRHLSEEDGKIVSASLLVQELVHHLGCVTEITAVQEANPVEIAPKFVIQSPVPLEKKDRTVSLADLSLFARNPWKYYLQKVERMYLEDRSPSSFHMQRAIALRSAMQWPLESSPSNLFHEALLCEVNAKHLEAQKQIAAWGKKIITLSKTVEMTLDNGSLIRITGDVPCLLEDGALHFGDDKLSSLLKIWPEALFVSVALQTSNIYCLKNGKIKTLADPAFSLRKFLEYYCRCSSGISPLLLCNQDMQDARYEDVATNWLKQRLEEPSLENWAWLRDVFSELIALYPVKELHETV